ncbi:MAG: hypothetical protein MI922_05595 [Bacteroidales bacterium]|nr:hypothetical protein [Bacteroidales bacterium]
MNRFLVILLIACSSILNTYAQPTEDMHIPKYGDDKTPYPLYGGSFGIDIKLNDADIQFLADNFNAYYGSWKIGMEEADKLRSIDPQFDLLSYRGNWRIGYSDRDWVDNGNRNEMVYYRVGFLKNSINIDDNKIVIDSLFGALIASDAHPDSLTTYKIGEEYKFNTFLKIGEEYLRIDSVNANIAFVNRGYDNSKAFKHKAGSLILAPIYGRPPQPEGIKPYEYRQSEHSMLRWKEMLRDVLENYHTHHGGIWIDILIGNLSHYAMSGETVPPELIYNPVTNKVYNKLERAMDAEKGIKYIQDLYYTIYGKYPLIWGNNMMYPIDHEHDRVRMLKSTSVKPRPINGFAQENSVAHYGYGGHSGKLFMYTPYEEWQLTLRSNMFCGENKLSNCPIIMDGGIDNKKFAKLPKERRHELFMYGYATYLLGVKVEDNGEIYSKFGLCPVVLDTEKTYHFELDPCFTWDIGKPIETHASKDYLNYKLDKHDVYVRKFENGIVLVNPTEKSAENVSLKKYGKYFVNPDVQEQKISKVSLAPRQGLILLNPTK